MAGRFSAKNQKLHARKRKRRVWLFAFYIFFFFLLFFLIAWSSYASFWNIQTITVTGTLSDRDTGYVESAVRDVLEEPSYIFFSGSNVFFFSKQKIKQKVLSAVVEYGDVMVDRIGLTGVEVSVFPRKSVALYCDTQNCFKTDEFGIPFEVSPASTTPTDSYFVVYGTTTPKLGVSIVSKDELSSLLFFQKQMALIELPIKGYISPDTYIFESGGKFVLLDGVSRTNSLLILNAIRKDGSVPLGEDSFMSKLEYLNIVGSSGKVVYKFK